LGLFFQGLIRHFRGPHLEQIFYQGLFSFCMPVQKGPDHRNVAFPLGHDGSAQQVPLRLGELPAFFVAFFWAGKPQL
jgi:hypothetical protein